VPPGGITGSIQFNDGLNPTGVTGENDLHWDKANKRLGIGTTGPGAFVDIAKAGTTTVPPLRLASGTNLTSPLAGAFEYDGTVHYTTHAASERGVLVSEQWIVQNATHTLANQQAAQAIFDSVANGAVTVAGSTTYEFECWFNLTSMSASSGGYGFAIGGAATLTSIRWYSLAQKSVAVGTTTLANNSAYSMNDTAANTDITGNTTTTTGSAYIRGIIRVNAGGTIIPQVSLEVAAAAVIGINSFFRIWPIGTNTGVSVGNWS